MAAENPTWGHRRIQANWPGSTIGSPPPRYGTFSMTLSSAPHRAGRVRPDASSSCAGQSHLRGELRSPGHRVPRPDLSLIAVAHGSSRAYLVSAHWDDRVGTQLRRVNGHLHLRHCELLSNGTSRSKMPKSTSIITQQRRLLITGPPPKIYELRDILLCAFCLKAVDHHIIRGSSATSVHLTVLVPAVELG